MEVRPPALEGSGGRRVHQVVHAPLALHHEELDPETLLGGSHPTLDDGVRRGPAGEWLLVLLDDLAIAQAR
jgi:hypothetical protein